MKRLMILITLVLTGIGILSCNLERSNPLDPKGNPRIRVPHEVVGLTLKENRQHGTPQFIEVTWDRATVLEEDADRMGYFIYRSYSRHSRFEKIHTEENINITRWEDRNNIVSQKEYWYRISAFIDYPEGRLEGKLSPITEQNAIWIN